MSQVILVFVGGDSTIDNLIEKFSGGVEDNISHAAILLLNSTVEATGEKEEHDLYSGTWPHDYDKYFANPNAKFIQIEVADLAAGEKTARQLIGTPYGYGDCVRTGIFELWGIKVPDNTIGIHCSEFITRVIRPMGVNVLPDLEPGQVGPPRLYKSIMEDWHGQNITEQFRACS